MCNIFCDPGYTRSTTDCNCEFTDGCEAAGQPCQNEGNCVSDLSAPPYYSCQCGAARTGQNCESECVCMQVYLHGFYIFLNILGIACSTHTVCNISCNPGYMRNTTNCSCELTDGCEAAGQPCQNGGKCVSDLSAPPYYSCQCGAGRTGQNCTSECVYMHMCLCISI